MIDGFQRKLFGIEVAAPFDRLFMLFVLWVGNRFQIIVVTPNTSDIFRRAGSLTIDTAWIGDVGFRGTCSLQLDRVPPIVAEVIRALIAKFLQESLQIIGVAVNVADQIVHGDKVAGIRKHYRRGVQSNPRSQLREEAGSNRHLRNNLVSTNCHAITLAAFTHLLPKWDPEMIYFRDFEPRKLKSAGIFNAAEYQSVGSILEDLNDWIRDENIEVVNIETVVLPNIHNWNEKGTSDPELITGGDVGSTWHQFFRVWYKAS